MCFQGKRNVIGVFTVINNFLALFFQLKVLSHGSGFYFIFPIKCEHFWQIKFILYLSVSKGAMVLVLLQSNFFQLMRK